ncbi:MAG: prenyltransferase [Euryarchaeota archaeon]|nr:prenyltransferase [Euryarchaeota archaeon]
MSLRVWLVEIRAPFLLLPVILAIVGSSLAIYDGYFDAINFALFTIVLVLLHITVNTLNEYYDHRTGIDFNTRKTMFNGGTGILQTGLLLPRQVLTVSIGCFIIAGIIAGVVIARTSLLLAPLVILGMLFSLFYTQIFARNMLGEMAAGLGLGVLPVIGAYMIHNPVLTVPCIALSAMAGILTFNLLLLNEFPDLEADMAGGRKNIVMALGIRKAAWLYAILTFSVYAILLIFVILRSLPTLSLLGLLTLPFAFKAATMAFIDPRKTGKFLQGQKANVQMILGTQAFVAIGLLAAFLLAT